MAFKKADDVQEIAEEIIEEFHPHLVGIKIVYVFHEKASIKAGKMTLATAKKIGGLAALLVKNMLPTFDFGDPKDAEFFVIDVAFDTWEKLKPHQQRALIDHELCHCWVDKESGSPVLMIIEHDINEFGNIVRRHGLWDLDLKEFQQAMKAGTQIKLPLDEDATALVTA